MFVYLNVILHRCVIELRSRLGVLKKQGRVLVVEIFLAVILKYLNIFANFVVACVKKKQLVVVC